MFFLPKRVILFDFWGQIWNPLIILHISGPHLLWFWHFLPPILCWKLREACETPKYFLIFIKFRILGFLIKCHQMIDDPINVSSFHFFKHPNIAVVTCTYSTVRRGVKISRNPCPDRTGTASNKLDGAQLAFRPCKSPNGPGFGTSAGPVSLNLTFLLHSLYVCLLSKTLPGFEDYFLHASLWPPSLTLNLWPPSVNSAVFLWVSC